jgi:hypothetical protein
MRGMSFVPLYQLFVSSREIFEKLARNQQIEGKKDKKLNVVQNVILPILFSLWKPSRPNPCGFIQNK